MSRVNAHVSVSVCGYVCARVCVRTRTDVCVRAWLVDGCACVCHPKKYETKRGDAVQLDEAGFGSDGFQVQLAEL